MNLDDVRGRPVTTGNVVLAGHSFPASIEIFFQQYSLRQCYVNIILRQYAIRVSCWYNYIEQQFLAYRFEGQSLRSPDLYPNIFVIFERVIKCYL